MITIRKAVRGDARAIWDIRRAAIRQGSRGHYPPETVETWAGGDYLESYPDKVSDSHYVATCDGIIVGAGAIELQSGEITAMCVHPEHMGRGIGARIMRHLEVLAKEAGLESVSLDASLNAAPFYRACGFRGEATSTYKSPRGYSLDCIPMRKRLA